jgi:hypothetical protein
LQIHQRAIRPLSLAVAALSLSLAGCSGEQGTTIPAAPSGSGPSSVARATPQEICAPTLCGAYVVDIGPVATKPDLPECAGDVNPPPTTPFKSCYIFNGGNDEYYIATLVN